MDHLVIIKLNSKEIDGVPVTNRYTCTLEESITKKPSLRFRIPLDTCSGGRSSQTMLVYGNILCMGNPYFSSFILTHKNAPNTVLNTLFHISNHQWAAMHSPIAHHC